MASALKYFSLKLITIHGVIYTISMHTLRTHKETRAPNKDIGATVAWQQQGKVNNFESKTFIVFVASKALRKKRLSSRRTRSSYAFLICSYIEMSEREPTCLRLNELDKKSMSVENHFLC